MQLGFMTNVPVRYGMKDLETVARWAAENGFVHLEVGPTIPLDEREFDRVRAETGVAVSALTYCRNYLSSDPEEAEHHLDQLKQRILFAGRMGIPRIVTSTGIDKKVQEGIYDTAESIRKAPARSLQAVTETFLPLVELAEGCGVQITFENCPLMGNIAISPVLWEQLFQRLDSANVGLTFDPSHLVWQHMDPYACSPEFAHKIFHVHAKDMHIDRAVLARTGFLTDFSWWHARIPGRGDLDWARLLGTLKACGFDGTVSLEHEDSDVEGSLEKVQQGLLLGRDHLRGLL